MRDATPFTRRHFLQVAAATATVAALPLDALASRFPAPAARYRRYSVTTPEGQRALASYARAVDAMLKLPAGDPHNWFHNAFVHLMDCPHGNWWFYVWHRGYVGYFEQSVRKLSGDATFAFPFWDWTTTPRIPDGLFDGALNPSDAAFQPYNRNLGVFTATFKPALANYLNTLTSAQVAQLRARGYGTIDKIWDDVTGHDPKLPNQPDGHTNNVAFANSSGARYLTRDNPTFDENTARNVSPFVIRSGLAPTAFYDPNGDNSFTSSKTVSHNTAPGAGTVFSMLEGLPHNKVHNYIGGVGPLDPGPWGNMTNFLSPVDPIFFLHHANMDRLWDIWTRKQQAAGLPYLPAGADLDLWSKEPFLFFVDADGKFITNGKAGDYVSTERWGYDYGPGFGEDVIPTQPQTIALHARAPRRIAATIRANAASAAVPADTASSQPNTAAATSVAKITLARANGTGGREFDVLVGDGPNAQVAGTLALFGHMNSMAGMSGDATFIVPLPPRIAPSAGLLARHAAAPLSIRVVQSHDAAHTPVTLRSVSVIAR